MTNVQMAIFTLMCAALSVVANLIQGVALEPTLIGIAVLLAIVFGGVVIYKLIYNSGLNVSDACARIRETIAPGENRDKILSFIEKSGRGIIR